MTSIRRILFAVRSPEAARQPGLAKAIQVARAFGATLELFHALGDAVFIELMQFEADKVDRLRQHVEEETRKPLLRLCEAARRHGVQAECSVEWDYPPHEAIARRATKTGADLIIAECHKGARTRPWLIHLTDWELLRISPLPVLLLKNGSPYRRPLTLAAVDPARAHLKPRDLDARIVATATEFSRVLRGELHVMHANYPSIAGVSNARPAKRTTWSTLTYEQLMEQERQTFEAFRASAGLRRTRAHLVDGNPAVAIPRFAREMGAGIVVMGALSRSGLSRVLIGNTAERVLDALPCDVLVVKPEGTMTRTAQESRVARAPRGMRIISRPHPSISA